MSILFSTFVVEIRNRSLTPKNNKNMRQTNQDIIDVLEYINKEGLSNSTWQIVTNDVDAHAYYGAEVFEVTLPPHIAIWVTPERQVEIFSLVRYDTILTTVEDDMVAILYL